MSQQYELYQRAIEEYQKGTPIMTDKEFDILESQITNKGKEQIIGTPGKAKLPIRMWSMLKDPENKLANKTKCLFQLKIDGVALLLHYKAGILYRAYTRGDGIEGQDITFHLYPKTEDIPTVIPESTRDIFVIGEAYITKSSAEALEYKNARNGIAGILNHQQHTEGNAHIRFFAFDISYKEKINYNELQFLSEGHKLRALKDNGFSIVMTFADFDKAHKTALEQRDSLPYLIDGIVIKVLNTKAQQILGYTERAPRFYSAFKLQADADFAVLQKVEWNVGRTGQIIPLAHFSPVTISGSTIRKATLHSYTTVNGLQISIGDKLQIVKAGDIIPQIERIVERSGNNPVHIDNCPSCGSIIKIEGAHAKCIQPLCKDKVLEQINYICKTIGIKGVGPAKIKNYYLAASKHPTAIEVIFVMSESILFPQKVPLWKMIQAFNTKGLGVAGAKQAARSGHTLKSYIAEHHAEALLHMFGVEE